jgi:hypothetical protein
LPMVFPGETPGAQVDLYIEYAIIGYVLFLIFGGIATVFVGAKRLDSKKS